MSGVKNAERDHRGSEHTLNNGRDDGGNEKGTDENGKPVGFWDKGLKEVRLKVMRKWALMTLVLSAFILLVLSLYWAVLYRVEQNLDSLIVYVVNFEETVPDAFVGPMITGMTEQQVATNLRPHLGYITMPPSDFNDDPMLVRQAVYEEHAWAAVIINANASILLRSAVETGNASYDPLGACQLVYNEARDESTYSNYIYPQLNMLQTEATSMVGQKWTARTLANTSIARTNLQEAPQALSPAIGFSVFNLRPFTPATSTPAVTIGLIYLIIISFFTFSFFMPIHMLFMDKSSHPPLKIWQLVVWRWTATVIAYLILSLAYSLVSLAFQIPFSHDPAPADAVAQNANAYGRGSFVVYWMINYVGMIALGLACENAAMVVGMPWTSLWLIFWVITNVCTSFYAIELSPHFFYWGYAWPLHNIVEASRTVIFDTKSRIGLNFGVLLAWCAVNTALFPICSWFMRWKSQRAQKNNKDE